MNVTSDPDLAERMSWLRAHAFGKGGKHFWHEELGYGYRMSSLQAAMGLAQMERIEELVERRRHRARLYNKLFQVWLTKKLSYLRKSNGLRAFIGCTQYWS